MATEMCESCYRDRGSPKIDTPDVRTAAKLIGVIYDHSAVGEPFHVYLDDWNLDGTWEPYWGDSEDEYEPEHRAAAAVLGELVTTMTSEERASALGLHDGYWAIERWEEAVSEIIERGGQPGEQDISTAKLPKLPSGPGPGEPKITVTRATGLIPVSVELADDGRLGKLLLAAIRDHVRGPKPPPPPDPGPHPVYVRLLDAAEPTPALKELVELHKARPSFVHQDGSVGWWECEGDEFGGYDGERPEWPCETVGIIAKHLGVSLEEQ